MAEQKGSKATQRAARNKKKRLEKLKYAPPPKPKYSPVEGAGAFVKRVWRESSIGQKMGLPLKTFARTLSKQNTEAGTMARAWLANKRAA